MNRGFRRNPPTLEGGGIVVRRSASRCVSSGDSARGLSFQGQRGAICQRGIPGKRAHFLAPAELQKATPRELSGGGKMEVGRLWETCGRGLRGASRRGEECAG